MLSGELNYHCAKRTMLVTPHPKKDSPEEEPNLSAHSPLCVRWVDKACPVCQWRYWGRDDPGFIHWKSEELSEEDMRGNKVTIQVTRIERETEKAFLVIVEEKKEWVPKSQIEEPGEYHEGDQGIEMVVSEWIAGEKGFV